MPDNLRHPDVRNLAWLIASAPLLRGMPPWHRQHGTPPAGAIQLDAPDFWQQHASRYTARLRELDSAPQPLLQALARQKSTRLGRYAESLLLFWLTDGAAEQYHPYTVLAHGVQLFDRHGQTSGELDFIVRNHATQQIEHWELALKYYLLDAWQPARCAFAWKGLQSNDSLGRKVAHMLEKPFQTRQITVTATDGKQSMYDIQVRRAVLKGRLFSPVRYGSQSLPPWLEPQHLHGNWHLCSTLHSVPAGWTRLPRKQWLALPPSSPPAHSDSNCLPDHLSPITPETSVTLSATDTGMKTTVSPTRPGLYLNPRTGDVHVLRFSSSSPGKPL